MLKHVIVLGLLISVPAFARPVPSASEVLAKASGLLEAKQDDQPLAFDWSGVVSMPGCSGSVVSFGQPDTAKAIVMTNGHCIGMLDGPAAAVLVNQPYRASISFFVDQTRKIQGRVTKISYGILMPHDVAWLETDKTYGELAAQGVKARRISARMADIGTSIAIPSGYWSRLYSCKIEKIIHEVREAEYVNLQSYKYHCETIHGTSGSPIIDVATNEVVGVNYTGNDDGEQCTFNNPCEVDEQGNITVEEGANYGDQVYKVMACLNSAKDIDLSAPGCKLPR
jgi:V8-like Glu-specific endopeptidase